MKNTIHSLMAALTVLLTGAFMASAGPTIDWTGAVDDDWHNPGNWTLGRVPIDGDRVELQQQNQTAIYSVAPVPLPSYYPFVVGLTTPTSGTMTLILQDDIKSTSAGLQVVAAGKVVQTAGLADTNLSVSGRYELQGGKLDSPDAVGMADGGVFQISGGTVEANRLLGNDFSGAGTFEVTGGTVDIGAIDGRRGLNLTMTGGTFIIPTVGRATFSTESSTVADSLISIGGDAVFQITGPTNGEMWIGTNGNRATLEVIGSDAYVAIHRLQSTSGDSELAFQLDADGVTPVIITDLIYPANIELDVDAQAYDPSNGLSVVLVDYTPGRFLMNPKVFDAVSVTPPTGYTATIDMGNNTTKKTITLELTPPAFDCTQIKADALGILCGLLATDPPRSAQAVEALAITAIGQAFAAEGLPVDIDCQDEFLTELGF